MKSRTWFKIVFILLPFHVFCQLTVSPTNTATALAQAITGSGVTVTNATLNCGNNAAGTFFYAGADLGVPKGILLTTGQASDVANAGSYLANNTNGNNFSDPNLVTINPNATFDACILQFDFVAVCDSMKFTYVFGSEEYPQGVGHNFNDAFGVFLTGSKPAGGNYNGQNIATLPNGTAVSINNVNAGTNSSDFINNYSSPNNDIAYNGYTIPVTSITPVTPCSTYHMKIAIADGGNPQYDSGVFIQGNSITCQNPAVVTITSTTTGCNNTGTASINITNYSGSAPSYQWLPGGQTTQTITGLGAGTYTCFVGLSSTCGVKQKLVTTIASSSPSNSMVLTTAQQNPSCNGGANGSATVTVNGGFAPFSYVWSNAQTTYTVSNLSAGVYTATVTDNIGCESTATVSITSPPAITTSMLTTAASCTAATGAATVTVTGNGTPNYSYLWNTNPVQTTQVASNLTHGTYTVLITDANSCTVTATANVGVKTGNWLVAATATNVTCNGQSNGTASVSIPNGTTNTFSYEWNNNIALNTASINNLSAGTNTCTITDNNGCVKTATVTVTQPNLLAVSVNTSPAICSGSVGKATAIVTGGTPNYSYTWSTVPVKTTQAITNLSPNQYSVSVTDANGCPVVTAVGTVTSVKPSILSTSTFTNSICGGPNGAINITPTSGTGPYTYSWSPAEQNSDTLRQLTPNTYSVTITDANICKGNATVTVSINPVLPLTVSSLPDYCNKGQGSITTVVSNGNPPYTYVWNITPSCTLATASNLHAGNYIVHVTDAVGCTNSMTTTIVNHNDVFNANFSLHPQGEVYAENPVTLSVSLNQGWSIDTAYLSDGTTINALSFNHIFNQYGNYNAVYYFISTHGCIDSLKENIKVIDEMTLYIPNSFSPNNDGRNDLFKADGTFINTFEMYIYNRWGNLITKLDDINKAWNGEEKGANAPEDVYIYKGTASSIFGKTVTFQGQITIIR